MCKIKENIIYTHFIEDSLQLYNSQKLTLLKGYGVLTRLSIGAYILEYDINIPKQQYIN